MAGDVDLIIHGCQGVRVMELTVMAVIASKLAILLRV
jgi:N-acetylglucosamine-6-phosphate deacetylase